MSTGMSRGKNHSKAEKEAVKTPVILIYLFFHVTSSRPCKSRQPSTAHAECVEQALR